MASISIKNVYKTYPGNVTAVRDFSLEIEDREFIVLVGPSGCGKSTTLRMIAGLEEISEGELYIGNRLVNDVAPKDRDIAMVFQNYALYPHMTVFKNMAFGLQLRKLPKDDIKKKVEEAARILDIESLMDRKPKQLSGGQRQRVALGRAMVRDPSVFLLDEPLSNLDAKLRLSMRAEITKLHRRLGTTFVYVTHDQVEAITMGDRIVVMKDGLIQQVDKPQTLYDFPCNTFVAGFIGTPQMNFMSAVVRRKKSGFVATAGGGELPIPPERVEAGVLSAYEGKEVQLGVRPEDLYTEPAGHDASFMGLLRTEVDLTELMGSELYLYLVGDKIKLIARVPVRSGVRDGEKLELGVDCRRLHVFDPESGNNIGRLS